jgi:hypothetical protein
MGDLRADPTDEQRNTFEEVTVLGDVDVEEFSGFDNQLSPQERVHLIAGIEHEKGKHLLIITNQRVITFSSAEVVTLGEKNEYTDIKIDAISDIQIQDLKDFDRITIRTEEGENTYMVPEQTGVKIAGEIRDLQKNLDSAEQLENLSDQHDKGNLTDEEYERKKRELVGDD